MWRRPRNRLPNVEREEIVSRYRAADLPARVGYATVRDYCDSADHLPRIWRPDGDLKNVQRPWMVKAILAAVPPGSSLLEIGAGTPEVAALLAELGYRVTAVDPYEGEAAGPTDFRAIARNYPRVTLRRSRFGKDAAGLPPAGFDAVYSISVLEHLPPEEIGEVFAGIRKALAPGGASIHCVDHVVEGDGAEWHERIVRRILREQDALDSRERDSDAEYDELMRRLRGDLETFYLPALGHHQWRGGRLYDEFPFRKVISIQLFSRARA